MKILSLILIFYILLISSYPCCEETGKANISANLTEHDSGDHSNTCTDICSPFFECGSCTGFGNPEHLSTIDPKLVLLDADESTFCPPIDFDYFNHIWQPPKIS